MSREAEEGPDPPDEGARLSDWLLAPIRASQVPPPAPEGVAEPEAEVPPPAEAEAPVGLAAPAEPAHDDEPLVVAGAAPRGKAWVLLGALLLLLLGGLLVLRSLYGRSPESSPGTGPGAQDLPARAPAGDDLPPPPPDESEDLEAASEGVGNEPSLPGESGRSSTAVDPGPASSASGGPSVGRFPDLPWSILRTLDAPTEDKP